MLLSRAEADSVTINKPDPGFSTTDTISSFILKQWQWSIRDHLTRLFWNEKEGTGREQTGRPWPCTCSWLHWQFWRWTGKGKEGQRPAPGHCSSSGGSVSNQRVEAGKLVRLQLACPKQSAHLPTAILSPCNTDSACEPASPQRNPSGIRLGPQAGQRSRPAATPVVSPGRRPVGSRWGWRWSCWCCFSSGCSAPRWEPAGPSPPKNCRSTPAESTITSLNLHANPFPSTFVRPIPRGRRQHRRMAIESKRWFFSPWRLE